MSNIVEVRNLSIDFNVRDGKFRAVDNISFDIQQNKTLALVGESGSGKSVTAMSIMQLLPFPQSSYTIESSIKFNNKEIINASKKDLLSLRGNIISMVFQEPMTSLNPYHRVGDQITESVLLHSKVSKKEAKDEAINLMNLVEIDDVERRFNSYPHELSGGQRQRIMIAMALVNKPKLLIADEPTTALDVTIQAQILDLMSKLKRELGMSILFITHDLGLVREFSDQVCVMQNGNIVENGNTADVFDNPKHAYTQKLLNAEPKPKTIINHKEDPLIKIENLDVFYNMPRTSFFKSNRFHAVKDTSINIYKNTTIGLVGESGSGKSTLGKAIANLTPYEGKIYYDGQDIASSSKEIKKHIQIVFQDPYGSLSPRMTVGEIVGEGLGVHFNLSKKESDFKIDKVLTDVGIELNAKNKYPHEFSGGQRQRIAIARSLIMNPNFMILDEPTSALDRSIQIQVINLLKDIQNEYELTYLFISHDLKVIRSMSDYIFVMKDGIIVESGLSNDVFDYPKEKYTKKLLSAALRYATDWENVNKMSSRKYSKELVDGPNQAASRSMLRGVGFTSEDFTKPFVGIASTGAKVTPCNMHINQLSELVEDSINASGGKGVLFNTITVSDGISMGTQGMKYSLVSREVIADSIETVVGCLGYDGLIAIGGCDKNMPGCLIGMARLNRPSIFIYGGSIKPSNENTDYVTVSEKVGEFSKGSINEDELIHYEKISVDGPGSCGGMYTANTMASAIEALGMSLPGSSSQDATSKSKNADCVNAGSAIMNLLNKDIKPSDIMTREAFENAITVVIALGGSTNAVLHLLAMAHSIGVELCLDDFTSIGKKTPVLADLKPSGKHYMSELNANGGIQPLMKTLLDKGLLHGQCMTVTGNTLEENLKDIKAYETSEIIKDFNNPIKKDSHLRILYGNLAKDGAVAKITGKEGTSFEGKAKVFNSEEEGVSAILSNQINDGDVIVIRYEGPKGGPGMREMLKPTSAIMGLGLGDKIGFITDGRFSGGTHGFVVGHVSPEAAEGGLIALVEDGDTILIDAESDQLVLKVDDDEIKRRQSIWKNPNSKPKKGVLAKYAESVKSASLGAITD